MIRECWGCGASECAAKFERCKTCREENLGPGLFCSADCLAAHWPRHRKWHKAQRAGVQKQAQIEALAGTLAGLPSELTEAETDCLAAHLPRYSKWRKAQRAIQAQAQIDALAGSLGGLSASAEPTEATPPGAAAGAASAAGAAAGAAGAAGAAAGAAGAAAGAAADQCSSGGLAYQQLVGEAIDVSGRDVLAERFEPEPSLPI